MELPGEKSNNWLYLMIIIGITIFLFLYVDLNISFKKQNGTNRINNQNTVNNIKSSSEGGNIYHAKIKKVIHSAVDQKDELDNKFYN